MENNHIWESIAKYLAGESTVKEKESISAWQQDNANNSKILNLLSRIRIIPPQLSDSDGSRKNVLEKLEKEFSPDTLPHKSRKIAPVIWAIAATLSLFVMLGLYYRHQQLSVTSPDFIVFNNPAGEKASLILPDGSEVWLNAGTQLVYPEQFTGNNREVFLTGEAYFNVTKDRQHPFIVKTGSVEVKVMGTTFNLKAYFDEDKVEATLLSGAVSLSLADNDLSEPVSLVPDQRAVYKKSDRSFVLENTDPLIYTAWKEGIINCRSQRFEELTHSLERIFNVTIVILNEDLKNEVYTGKFENNESLEDILEVIQISTKMNYQTRGKVIEIQ